MITLVEVIQVYNELASQAAQEINRLKVENDGLKKQILNFYDPGTHIGKDHPGFEVLSSTEKKE